MSVHLNPSDAEGPNELEIRRSSAWMHGHAQWATAHLPNPGMLQLVSIDPSVPRHERRVLLCRFEIGDDKRMGDLAIEWAKERRLVWIEARTVVRGSPGRGDTQWIPAIVLDYDGYGKAPLPETFSVQTSPGNAEKGEQPHAHLWYATSLSPEQGKQIGKRLRKAAGADADTGVITQPYLLPGVPNFPSYEKIAEGRRTATAKTFIWTGGGPIYTFEQFDALLPQLPMHQPVVFDDVSGRSLDQVSEHIWTKAKMADRLLTLQMPGDRSTNFCKACFIAFSSGVTAPELERFILSEAKHGCASKWIARGELRGQLERQWYDWAARQNAA